jgi:outer membrane protein assembly factor BamA
MQRLFAPLRSVGAFLVLLGALHAGCASIPARQYGVTDVEWSGVEQMSKDALEQCLATRERGSFELALGSTSPSCGSPPFDEEPPRLTLWSWPWTDWPVYDPAIFDIDKRRIERWYRARGYYQAKVVGARYELDGEPVPEPDRCTVDDCELSLHIEVQEGEPVLVSKVELIFEPHPGGKALDAELKQELLEIPTLHVGDRFDEAPFEADKAVIIDALRERSYAHAAVKGAVAIDRTARTAHVRYTVLPGPSCVFGSMRIEGNGPLDAGMLQRVAGIKLGRPFAQSTLADAESAVYALGGLASVRIDPTPRADNPAVLDLVMRVMPGRLERWRFGIGVMSGTLQRFGETFAVSEWDVHLKAGYRNENFLGGFRKLRIEDRPRLIFQQGFPGVPDYGPRLGNVVTVAFEQPEFLEQRTVLFIDNRYDFGPDSYYDFFRHDVATKVGLRRALFRQKLKLEFAVQHDLFEILETSSTPDTVSDYRLPFLEQSARVDLRDDGQRPTRGFYFGATVQEALQLGYGSWDYVRILPEARAYQRLPLRIVLAQRFAIGALFVLDHDEALDETSEVLGPQVYRLRGGGANSNRGFSAGRLGAGLDGGTRRWEASFEVRVPLNDDLGFVLFFDAGDVDAGEFDAETGEVTRAAKLRFSHLNASAGVGLRYYSIIAPIRLDAGWRIPAWQVVDGSAQPDVETSVWPSALHLTLGEAF